MDGGRDRGLVLGTARRLEIQSFIADHERLSTTESLSEVAVEPFDVVMLPEGVLREDVLTPGDLARYRTLILPGCTSLTPAQVAAILGYLQRGGRVVATGELGRDLTAKERAALMDHPNLVQRTDVQVGDLASGPQVSTEGAPDMAIAIHRIGDREAAIHIIRYDYDEERDEVPVIPRLQLDVRLSRPFRSATALSPKAGFRSRLTFSGDRREMHRFDLEDVPLYCVIHLQ